jgi:hypothetical protein
MTATTQVYRVFIRSTPERIWEAITQPEFTARYFHGARIRATADGYVSHGPEAGGYCLVTVTHDQLEGAPRTAASVEGRGWMFVLSGLKTLLETGEPLSD